MTNAAVKCNDRECPRPNIVGDVTHGRSAPAAACSGGGHGLPSSRYERPSMAAGFGLFRLLEERSRRGGLRTVIGPSGAGKSSAPHAGLVPALLGGALERPWSACGPVVFTSGADPQAAFESALNSDPQGARPCTRRRIPAARPTDECSRRANKPGPSGRHVRPAVPIADAYRKTSQASASDGDEFVEGAGPEVGWAATPRVRPTAFQQVEVRADSGFVGSFCGCSGNLGGFLGAS